MNPQEQYEQVIRTVERSDAQAHHRQVFWKLAPKLLKSFLTGNTRVLAQELQPDNLLDKRP